MTETNKYIDLQHNGYRDVLRIPMSDFMAIQNRLLSEQLALYENCELGRRLLPDAKKPATLEEFRSKVPLTAYEDYADVLVQRAEGSLPGAPALWLDEPWNGSERSVKTVPYTKGMLESYARILSAVIAASAEKKGGRAKKTAKKVLGIAAPPFLTGLMEHGLAEELGVKYTEPAKNILQMDRRERLSVGAKMSACRDVGVVMGASGILASMSELFWGTRSEEILLSDSSKRPLISQRLLGAEFGRKRREVVPKSIWRPKSLICMGPDSDRLKARIEKDWGMRPSEIFCALECGIVALETEAGQGMTFLPDACFYEFIPLNELEKNMSDPEYKPRTYLIDELVAGESYELVITNFKGGALMRYRMGEIFRLHSVAGEPDGRITPRFSYVDNVPGVINIAGLITFTERTFAEAIRLSKLDIQEWFAVKEFDEKQNAYVHLYAEVSMESFINGAVTPQILHEHLSIYLRYLNPEYLHIKQLTGTDPLKLTILPTGTINSYHKTSGKTLRKMNPSHHDIVDVLRMAYEDGRGDL